MVTDLGVVHRRPTGTDDINRLVKFDAAVIQGLAKNQWQGANRWTGQSRMREMIEHGIVKLSQVGGC